MNSKLVASTVLAIAALSGVNAFAQTAPLSRAQVQADYLQAKQNGTLPVTGQANFAPAASSSKLSRAQVQAEYVQARSNGALPLNAEANYVTAPAARAGLSRADVRADARRGGQSSGLSAS